jgi:hypothetical protein
MEYASRGSIRGKCTRTSAARSKSEKCNIVWEYVDIIIKERQALAGLRDHVDCTDGTQAVNVDIGQCSFKVDDIELTFLWAVPHIASYFSVRTMLIRSYFTQNWTLTSNIVIEERVMACTIDENMFRVDDTKTPGIITICSLISTV